MEGKAGGDGCEELEAGSSRIVPVKAPRAEDKGIAESDDAAGAPAQPAVAASMESTGLDEGGGCTTPGARGDGALPGDSAPGEAGDNLRLPSPDAKDVFQHGHVRRDASPTAAPTTSPDDESALPTPIASFLAVGGNAAEDGEAVCFPNGMPTWSGEEEEAILPPPTHRFTPADVEFALSMLEPTQIPSLVAQEESHAETENQLQARFNILQRLE